MEKQKTQQFAKFYLKDIELKLQKDFNKKTTIEQLDFSTSN